MGLPVRGEVMADAQRNGSLENSCEEGGGGGAGRRGAGQAGRGGRGVAPAAADPSQAQQQPHSVFEYGNLRPDIPGSASLSTAGVQPRRAWLRGGRLYAFNQGGVEHAAVRLDESGSAVLGYVMNASGPTGIAGLLEESERRQYSPELYERDEIEVVTEMGEPVRCYVYHRPDVNRSNPIPAGDWRSRGNQ